MSSRRIPFCSPTSPEDEMKRVDTLLRISSLFSGDLLDRRNQILHSFTLAALSISSPDEVISIPDISATIHLLTNCTVSEENIISILSDLKKDGVVTFTNNQNVKLLKEISIPEFSERTQKIWEEFKSFLRNEYPDFDEFFDVNARNVFDRVILKLFARVTSSSQYLEFQVDSLPLGDFRKQILFEVSNGQFKIELKKKFPSAIMLFLKSKSEVLLDFIYENYSWLINMDILLRQQEIPEFDFQNVLKYMILDTSFIVNLLCRSDSLFLLSQAVVQRCRDNDIPLYFTNKTKEELIGLIRGSLEEMRHLRRGKKRNVIQSQFVSDFIRQTENWGSYSKGLENWETFLRVSYGINPLPDENPEDIDNEIYTYTYRTLQMYDYIRTEDRIQRDPNYQPRMRSENQYEHDAYNMGLIATLRKQSGELEEGSLIGPWYLSFDTLLSAVDTSSFGRIEGYKYVIQPRSLLNYLLVFSKVDFSAEEKHKVAMGIIQYSIRDPNPPITIESYTRLLTAKLSLLPSDYDLLHEILVTSPLKEELSTALKLNRGDQAEETTHRIITDKEFIESVVVARKNEEERERYLDKIKELHEKWNRERDARIEAEAQLGMEKDDKMQIPFSQTIVINQSTSVSVSNVIPINHMIDKQIEAIIELIKSTTLIQEGEIPDPVDLSSRDKLRSWLRKAKEVLSEAIEVKSLTYEAKQAAIAMLGFILSSI